MRPGICVFMARGRAAQSKAENWAQEKKNLCLDKPGILNGTWDAAAQGGTLPLAVFAVG